MKHKKSISIYLDYAASTPLAPEVVKAMDHCQSEFGNPGSLHALGQRAISLLDESRQVIAQSLGANFNEIIFTGSATEANNLALRGVVKLFKSRFPKVRSHLIISAIEHESVLATAKDLTSEGVELTILGVSPDGLINSKELSAALRSNTVLVSIMHAITKLASSNPCPRSRRLFNGFATIIKKQTSAKIATPYCTPTPRKACNL